MNGVDVEEILNDPLCDKYFPTGLRMDILQHAIQCFHLAETDIYKIADLDKEALRETISIRDEERRIILSICSSEDCKEKETTVDIPDTAVISEVDVDNEVAGDEDRIYILVNGDATEAKIILKKPAVGQEPPTQEEISKALLQSNVVYGVKEEFITRLAERPIYGKRFKIAEGQPAQKGEDGKAIYHFDTQKNLSPKLKSDGTVDYKELNYSENVKKGQLLCEIIPPVEGKDGYNIYGEVIPYEPGKEVSVRCGNNTVLDKEHNKIYAICDGQVSLRTGKILVSPVLVLDKVNISTGNILFSGTVQVNGDVAEGFTVHAGGDIAVRGTVEGAKLFSSGNIILSGGMKGMDTGVLEAYGDIRANFIENARISARGNIYADVIMNTKAVSGGLISLNGKNGYLIGGEAVAGTCIKAFQIGNEVRVKTHVAVRQTEKYKKWNAEISKKRDSLNTAIKNLEWLIQMDGGKKKKTYQFQFHFAHVLLLRQKIFTELNSLNDKFASNKKRNAEKSIVVRDTLYPGVLLEIDDMAFHSDTTEHKCMAICSHDRLRLVGYYD